MKYKILHLSVSLFTCNLFGSYEHKCKARMKKEIEKKEGEGERTAEKQLTNRKQRTLANVADTREQGREVEIHGKKKNIYKYEPNRSCQSPL